MQPPPVKNGLTPEEQQIRMDDLVLKRAEEIKAERRTNAALKKAAQTKLVKELKRRRLLRRCKTCKAMKFYLKNGKAPK